jgi:hypothetical protein
MRRAESFFFVLSWFAIRVLFEFGCIRQAKRGVARDTRVQQYLLGYNGSTSSGKDKSSETPFFC